MPITLTAGSSSPIPIDNLTDLKNSATTILNLAGEFTEHLDQPISSLPSTLKASTIKYASGNQKWDLGKFGFTLSGAVDHEISVITEGNLFSYTDEFPTQVVVGLATQENSNTTTDVPVPAGSAYVCVKLNFELKGGLSGKFSYGIYGVSGSASTQNTFKISFYKRCQPSDTLRNAISAAISCFVLPLHAATFDHLQPGDYLHHNFNANLQLGLGASIGFDKLHNAGQYNADITSNANILGLKKMPQVNASAAVKLAYHFDYAGTFEALLWLEKPKLGHYHLYRSSEQDSSLGLTAGLTLSEKSEGAGEIANQLGSSFAKHLPDDLAATFKKDVLPRAISEIDKYAKENHSKYWGWLKGSDSGKVKLEAKIACTRQNFLLADYTLDLTASASSAAWDLAVNGKFVDAITTANGGITISVGSGLEKLYNRTTSITLNLFGKFNATWSNAVISNSSLIYAGNNIFHLISNEGRQQLSLINGGKREIDMYFAAQVDLSAVGTASSGKAQVNLHAILQATNNSKFGKYIAAFLGLIFPGAEASALISQVEANAAQPHSTQLLHIVFPEPTYSRLTSSPLTKDGKATDETSDQQNYAAFAKACGDLFHTAPATFTYQGQAMNYAVWRNWNIASYDRWPIDNPGHAFPERKNPGSISSGNTYLFDQFPEAGGGVQLLSYALQAASDFMNFCADLQNLAALAAPEATLSTWESFVAHLKAIITNDLAQDFIAPTTLALARRCAAGSPATATGPAPGLAANASIAVTVNYS
jgi:hypothetical protein